MTRRSFLKCFTAAVAVLACAPESILPSPEITGVDINALLQRDIDRIHREVMKSLTRSSPYLDLIINNGLFPEHGQA